GEAFLRKSWCKSHSARFESSLSSDQFGASARSTAIFWKNNSSEVPCLTPSLIISRTGSDNLPFVNCEFLMKFSMCAQRLSRGASAPMYVASSRLHELLLRHSTTLCARSESTCVPSSQCSSPKLNVRRATRSFSSATSVIQMVSPPFFFQKSSLPLRRWNAFFDTSCLSCLRSTPCFDG